MANTEQIEGIHLTIKQSLFIDYYLELKNATKAAIKAGYAESVAASISSKMLATDKIKQELRKRTGETYTLASLKYALHQVIQNPKTPPSVVVKAIEVALRQLGELTERHENLNYTIPAASKIKADSLNSEELQDQLIKALRLSNEGLDRNVSTIEAITVEEEAITS